MAGEEVTHLTTASQAQTAFYQAFEQADLEAMMLVWDVEDSVACIHPHGPRLVGPAEVREGWRQILAHSPSLRFTVDELSRVENGDMTIAYVNEHIYVGNMTEPDVVILATNIYRRTKQGWRMILHHASPTPESLQRAPGDDDEHEEDEKVTVH